VRRKTILVIGAFDTTTAELRYVASTITAQGGRALTVDVGVGDPAKCASFSREDIATAAGSLPEAVIAIGAESEAIEIMAKGASQLARKLYEKGRIDGLIAIGGATVTDLALDCFTAVPADISKCLVSTLAFSPLITPERLPSSVRIVHWPSAINGLNTISKAILSQAASSVLGAAQAIEKARQHRSVIAMTSHGSELLHYAKILKPKLERRGFDVIVFHPTGSGGAMLESLAARGGFAAVLDLAPIDLAYEVLVHTSNGSAGRLTAAGKAGIPQIVAPGCLDLVEFSASGLTAPCLSGHPTYARNRLVKSAIPTAAERREVIRELGYRLAESNGSVRFILPTHGINEWDKQGGPTHDPEALAARSMKREHRLPRASRRSVPVPTSTILPSPKPF
jgi:uncharacterized protein (UPF0261 family)